MCVYIYIYILFRESVLSVNFDKKGTPKVIGVLG